MKGLSEGIGHDQNESEIAHRSLIKYVHQVSTQLCSIGSYPQNIEP